MSILNLMGRKNRSKKNHQHRNKYAHKSNSSQQTSTNTSRKTKQRTVTRSSPESVMPIANKIFGGKYYCVGDNK